MGGTLTLLIRHLVRADVEAAGGWKIALLYAVNTAGAAAGAFLTDFVLVPAAGLRATQLVAVALNVVAGVGALALARGRRRPDAAVRSARPPRRSREGPALSRRRRNPRADRRLADRRPRAAAVRVRRDGHGDRLAAALHAAARRLPRGVLAGADDHARSASAPARSRAACSSNADRRRSTSRPGAARSCSVVRQSVLVGSGRFRRLRRTVADDRLVAHAADPARGRLPSLLMGCSFPLANAIIQHAEGFVRPAGRRPVSRQHGRRRLRIARDRVRPAAAPRDAGHGDRARARRRADAR